MRNRTIYADDCLNVLNDQLEIEPNSIDLIYLDPPFNSKSTYTLPFKAKDKSARPVDVFVDTWDWDEKERDAMERFKSGQATKNIYDLVRIVHRMEKGKEQLSTAAYLVNMAIRLIPAKTALKPTGSIFLHCDPSAGHYLKLLMDMIFGKDNFRNEIVWGYHGPGSPDMQQFNRKHDTIFWYSISDSWCFNKDAVRIKHDPKTEDNFKEGLTGSGFVADTYDLPTGGKVPETWWIPKKGNGLAIAARQKKQYLGYPTQKPLALLNRIIKASSNRGDIVLDPFCGCGTAVHAAEANGRQWVGIDISRFSTGLIRNRILSAFPHLSDDDLDMIGVPDTPEEARELARKDKFEFEKWVCGHIGAEGMFHEPGTKGADGGVDGVLKFVPLYMGQKPQEKTAIVQVKGGNVTPDAVRALSETIERFDAKAGVIICFNNQMRTVENNRNKRHFKDSTGEYPVIQGLSVEDMLDGAKPDLPNIMKKAV